MIEPPLSPADPDRTSALFWLAVIVLPLVARILRGLREKAEGKSEERPRGRLPAQCFHWLFLRCLSKNALTIGKILSRLTVCPCEVISRVVSTPAALSAAANNSP